MAAFVFFARPRSLELAQGENKRDAKAERKEIRAARTIKRTFYRQIRLSESEMRNVEIKSARRGIQARRGRPRTNRNAMLERFAIREVVKRAGPAGWWGARTREPY